MRKTLLGGLAIDLQRGGIIPAIGTIGPEREPTLEREAQKAPEGPAGLPGARYRRLTGFLGVGTKEVGSPSDYLGSRIQRPG